MNNQLDLCVLGTGPSAFFLVQKFLKKNPLSKVLVLEAGYGKIDTNSPLSLRYSSETDFRLKPSINIGYGGTSQLWHNVLSPLDDEDFLHHSWIPNSGWQINKNILNPFYEEVSSFFGFSYEIFNNPQAYCNFLYEKNKIIYDENTFDYKVFVHPKKYLRTNKNFDELQKHYDGLEVRLANPGVRFIEKDNNNLLVAKNLKTMNSYTISSKKYVLCCGALNNPEILLNSKFIKDKLPHIGNFLMDHPMGNFFQYKYKNPLTSKIYSAIKFDKDLSIKIALKLKYSIQSKHNLANSAFFLRPSFSEGYNNKTEELKNKLLTVRSKLKKFKIPLDEGFSLIRDANMVAQIIQYKTGLLSKHNLTDIMFVTEQRPTLESKVALSDELNDYGNYKTKIKWHVSKEDIKEVYSIKYFIDNNLMSLNKANATYNGNNYKWEDRLSSAAHHLGTVRMSKDSRTGCVDSNLKLHGFNDIYVCDGSVFPTGGNANPTMTCMALASRLGDYLSND